MLSLTIGGPCGPVFTKLLEITFKNAVNNGASVKIKLGSKLDFKVSYQVSLSHFS